MYNDKNYDKKIDIWSLGCILYEMMTFNVPFQANDILALKQKVVNGIYYKDNLHYYSNELNYMVRFLLNVNPKQRPSIYQVLTCHIFKKMEHELNLSNSNDFNLKINDKFRNQYSIPDKSLSWNDLINNIENENENKLHSPVKNIINEQINNKLSIENDTDVNISKLPNIIKKNDKYLYQNYNKNPNKNYYPSYYKDYSTNNKKYPSYYDNYPIFNKNKPSQLPSINNNYYPKYNALCNNNIKYPSNDINKNDFSKYDYEYNQKYNHKYYKNKYSSNNIVF